MAGDFTTVDVGGREVRISNPAKVFFGARGETKLDLVRHYLTVGPGVLRGVWCRPTVLHRFPWPRTSGGRGMHIVARIVPTAGFTQVRDAALALARVAERRAPALIT